MSSTPPNAGVDDLLGGSQSAANVPEDPLRSNSGVYQSANPFDDPPAAPQTTTTTTTTATTTASGGDSSPAAAQPQSSLSVARSGQNPVSEASLESGDIEMKPISSSRDDGRDDIQPSPVQNDEETGGVQVDSDEDEDLQVWTKDNRPGRLVSRRDDYAPYDFSRGHKGPMWVLNLICNIMCALALLAVGVGVIIVSDAYAAPYRVDVSLTDVLPSTVLEGAIPSNGLRYEISNHGYKPGRFTSYFWVDAGSVEEDPDQLGLAHFCEHMAFDETENHSYRGGLWSAIAASGAGTFNAFTSWRTTMYQLWDMPLSNDPVPSIGVAFDLHKDQVFGQISVQANLDLEKGAVIGEDRFRNDSSSQLFDAALENHGGPDWRIAQRIVIGDPLHEDYSEESMRRFLGRWYRPDRLKMVIVGDFEGAGLELADVEAELLRVYESVENPEGDPFPKPDLGEPSPVEPIITVPLVDMEGTVGLGIITRPYESPPHTLDYHRRTFLNVAFTAIFEVSVQRRLAVAYPNELAPDFGGRGAAIEWENMYDIDANVGFIEFVSPGAPGSSTWRNDFALYLTELRRLADHGPSELLVGAIMGYGEAAYASQAANAWSSDSTRVIEDHIGDLDPDFVYQSADQEYLNNAQFFGAGWTNAAAQYIQAEAQTAWKSFVEAALGADFEQDPYDHLVKEDFSFTVAFNPADPREPEDSPARGSDAISVSDVAGVIVQVLNATPPDAAGVVDDLAVLYGFTEAPSADGVPADGQLVDVGKFAEPGEMAKLDDSHGFETWILHNGVTLNFKAVDGAPPHEAVMEIAVLGGRSVETPSANSACAALAGAGQASGYSVYGHKGYEVHYSVETLNAVYGAAPSYSCNWDWITTRFPVSSACASCDNTDVDWKRLGALARLALSPSFSVEDIGRAAKAKAAEERSDFVARHPLRQVLFHEISPRLLDASIDVPEGDLRFQPDTAATIEGLSPAVLTTWVQEQMADRRRIQVTVVGDVDSAAALTGLGLFLSPDLPVLPTPMIGLDPYNDDQVAEFTSWSWGGADGDVREVSCTLASVMEDRADVQALVPARDGVIGHPSIGVTRAGVEILMDAVMREHMFRSIRRDHGFSYFAIVRTEHSLLFPELGWYTISWGPGVYPPNADVNDSRNIQASLAVTKAALETEIPVETFVESQVQHVSALKAAEETTEHWLGALRGVSIRPPFAFGLPDDSFLKERELTEMSSVASGLTHAEFKEFYADLLPGHAWYQAFVDTKEWYSDEEGFGDCFD